MGNLILTTCTVLSPTQRSDGSQQGAQLRFWGQVCCLLLLFSFMLNTHFQCRHLQERVRKHTNLMFKKSEVQSNNCRKKIFPPRGFRTTCPVPVPLLHQPEHFSWTSSSVCKHRGGDLRSLIYSVLTLLDEVTIKGAN